MSYKVRDAITKMNQEVKKLKLLRDMKIWGLTFTVDPNLKDDDWYLVDTRPGSVTVNMPEQLELPRGPFKWIDGNMVPIGASGYDDQDPDTWEYDHTIGSYIRRPKKQTTDKKYEPRDRTKCECGVGVLGYGNHSHWCQLSPDYKEKSE